MTASILYDVTRKAPVAESVEIAANPWSRFLGLMGRKQLDDGSVLVSNHRTGSIHSSCALPWTPSSLIRSGESYTWSMR